MAVCPVKDKKRITLLHVLSVLVLLLLCGGLAYAYPAGSYSDDDFRRQITVDFAGGTADLKWVYMNDDNKQIYFDDIPFYSDNEAPHEGTFTEHANCRGYTPYLLVYNVSKEGCIFSMDATGYKNYNNWDNPDNNVKEGFDGYLFEAGCNINFDGDANDGGRNSDGTYWGSKYFGTRKPLTIRLGWMCSFNINWDSGVSDVVGHSTSGLDMRYSDGQTITYKEGTLVPTWIYLKDGYELDYIQEGDKKWYDSTWNEACKRWDNYWTMNRSRSIYIHTKKKEVVKSYKQTVYIRYQNQNGTWERWDDTSAITENVLCGSTYTFDTKNITGNSKWNSNLYRMPEQFDDGTSFTYKVSGAKTSYISVARLKIQNDQEIYVRYQNEDGSWGEYSSTYWHTPTKKAPDGYWENFLWHVDSGTSFGFGVEDIKQDSRWDATLYEFPDTYADGSSLRYTVTKACKKYVDISRKFILTLSQEDATTRGTQSVMVSYRKGLPDITVPEQKYKASFYDDDNYNDRLLLSDIVQINKFKGYMLKEKRNQVSLGSILNESYNYSDANADNSIISTVTLTRPYTGNLYFYYDGYNSTDEEVSVNVEWSTLDGDSDNEEIWFLPHSNDNNYVDVYVNKVNSIRIRYWGPEYGPDSYGSWKISLNIEEMADVNDYWYNSEGKADIYSYPYACNETVYAKWEESKITLPDKDEVTKPGFELTGWSDGINTYDSGDKISIKKDTRFYAIWEEVIPESNSESNITKAASTMYFDTLIRRTSGDEAWYDTVGSYSIKSLKDYSNNSCVQIWKIDIDGNITRMK